MNDIVLRGFMKQLRGRLRKLWALFVGDAQGVLRADRAVLEGKLQVYCGRLREQSDASDRDGWTSAPLPVERDVFDAGRSGSRAASN